MSNEYAFPRYANCQMHSESGMTLRDYFAAKAMQAIIAKSPCESHRAEDAVEKMDRISIGAYYYADAMLEARK